MKLNLEIELDWIDEDSTLDETVKREIVNRVVKLVKEQVEKSALEKTEKLVHNRIEKLVDKNVNQFFRNYLKQSVAVTDKWGDTVQTYKSLKELVKEKFDNFLTEKVDKDGRAGGYNANMKRIDYLIDVQIKGFAKTFSDETVTKVRKEVEVQLNDSLKKKIGGEITQLLKIDKMLEQNNE